MEIRVQKSKCFENALEGKERTYKVGLVWHYTTNQKGGTDEAIKKNVKELWERYGFEKLPESGEKITGIVKKEKEIKIATDGMEGKTVIPLMTTKATMKEEEWESLSEEEKEARGFLSKLLVLKKAGLIPEEIYEQIEEEIETALPEEKKAIRIVLSAVLPVNIGGFLFENERKFLYSLKLQNHSVNKAEKLKKLKDRMEKFSIGEELKNKLHTWMVYFLEMAGEPIAGILKEAITVETDKGDFVKVTASETETVRIKITEKYEVPKRIIFFDFEGWEFSGKEISRRLKSYGVETVAVIKTRVRDKLARRAIEFALIFEKLNQKGYGVFYSSPRSVENAGKELFYKLLKTLILGKNIYAQGVNKERILFPKGYYRNNLLLSYAKGNKTVKISVEGKEYGTGKYLLVEEEDSDAVGSNLFYGGNCPRGYLRHYFEVEGNGSEIEIKKVATVIELPNGEIPNEKEEKALIKLIEKRRYKKVIYRTIRKKGGPFANRLEVEKVFEFNPYAILYSEVDLTEIRSDLLSDYLSTYMGIEGEGICYLFPSLPTQKKIIERAGVSNSEIFMLFIPHFYEEKELIKKLLLAKAVFDSESAMYLFSKPKRLLVKNKTIPTKTFKTKLSLLQVETLARFFRLSR